MAAVLLPPGVGLRGDLEAGHTDLACRQRGKVKYALLAIVNMWLHASVMDGIVTAITDRERQIQNTMLLTRCRPKHATLPVWQKLT